MTEQQFDKTHFGKGDRIEVRNYLKKETEDIEFVDFTERRINGYKPNEIIQYIPNKTAEP